MQEIIKLIVLEHYKLISKIEESPSELGEPDCRLINPYVIKDDKSFSNISSKKFLNHKIYDIQINFTVSHYFAKKYDP